jgi:REP element-mobilizing transposase RayT
MSRKYKFYNKEGLYFVSFATVYWIDVFTRDTYCYAMVESLDFCRKNKGMEIYTWCLIPSHVHLIFRAKNSNVKGRQFWQQHNKPIELWSPTVIDQKVDYIHNNPVEAGFVSEPHYWKYSSAIDYSGGKGVLEIDFV